MDELISRQAAIDMCRKPHMRNADCSDFEMEIMMLPSAQPERKTGEWIMHTYMPHHNYCSECNKDSPYNKRWDFCPNCGADMRGEQDEVN